MVELHLGFSISLKWTMENPKCLELLMLPSRCNLRGKEMKPTRKFQNVQFSPQPVWAGLNTPSQHDDSQHDKRPTTAVSKFWILLINFNLSPFNGDTTGIIFKILLILKIFA